MKKVIILVLLVICFAPQNLLQAGMNDAIVWKASMRNVSARDNQELIEYEKAFALFTILTAHDKRWKSFEKKEEMVKIYHFFREYGLIRDIENTNNLDREALLNGYREFLELLLEGCSIDDLYQHYLDEDDLIPEGSPVSDNGEEVFSKL